MIYKINDTGTGYELSSRQSLAQAVKGSGYPHSVDGLSLAELERIAIARHLIQYCFSEEEAKRITEHNRKIREVRTLDEMIEAL
jgi:hypothetical protein